MDPATERNRVDRYEHDMARMELSLNPAPGRGNTELMRIRRALDEIKFVVNYWLVQTDDRPMKGWLSYKGIITAKAEEHYYLAKDYYDRSRIDDYGYLLEFHNAKQVATNRVTVASWYTNALERAFYVVKVIHSPIPCATWGRVPLSRKMWNVIILEMMSSTQLWGWLHAVREYTDDETFQVGGICGWHMERTKKLYQGDADPCTGQVIYHHIIQKFLPQSGME